MIIKHIQAKVTVSADKKIKYNSYVEPHDGEYKKSLQCKMLEFDGKN